MAPVEAMVDVAKRQFFSSCPSGYYRSGNTCYRRGNNNWYNWGRWVALVLIVLFFCFIFFLLSCINARRRRRRGLAPRYGTGWLGGKPGAYNNNQYNNPQTFQPAPPYSPPPADNYNQNAGYYGGQQSGIELQQPQNAYHPGTGGSPAYMPPPGPPPGKSGYQQDGVVR